MLRLRLLHTRAREEPGFEEPDPRPAMANLAREFPGALREIDDLTLDVIRSRIDALAAAEADPACVASWMRVHARFHALARGALAVKRWLAGRAATSELASELATVAPSWPEREALEWTAELAAIAKPPRGRVMDLVYARLAHELEIDVSAVREAVMPPRAKTRRSLRGGGP